MRAVWVVVVVALGVVGAAVVLGWDPRPRHDRIVTDARVLFGSGSWAGARTSADGRTLVVAVIGGRPFDRADPCSVAYTGHAAETADAVLVRFTGRMPPGSGSASCTLEGHPRLITVRLAQPLGRRQVVDTAFDRTEPVFDGARLLGPSGLRPGWRLLDDRPSAQGGWVFAWGTPRPDRRTVSCRPGLAPISVTIDPRPNVGAPAQPMHTVNGRVEWDRGSDHVSVDVANACELETLPTQADLFAFAQSLRPGSP